MAAVGVLPPAAGPPRSGRHRRAPALPLRRAALIVTGIVAVAVNLRSGVTSLGAVLGDVTAQWSLSGPGTGLVTALPVVTFAVVGAAAPALARRLGPARLLAAAMALDAAGLLARALAGPFAVFAASSALSLSGAAVGNVVLPPLVKRWFPDAIGRVTAVHSTALAIGMAGGAALTPAVAQASGGGWRTGLGVWAAVALLAAAPWWALARSGGRDDVAAPRPVAVHRSPVARDLAVFFGCQSLNAYVVLGWLPTILAGAGVGSPASALVVVGAMTVPMSLLVPVLAARRPSQRGLVVLTTAAYAGGYLGLLCAPAAWPWLCAALLGAGNGAFPLAVTMIGLRSRGPDATLALSAFVQSGGYLLAAAGPLLVGVLYRGSGGWSLPLWVLVATLAVQLGSGLRAAVPAPRHRVPSEA